MQPEPSGGSSSFAEGLCAFLKSAGVLKTSVIRVIGEGGIQALLWLCRHGYEQAGFMHGPSPAEPADVVLAPMTCSPERLDAVLAQTSHLRPGGLVVLRARRGSDRTTAELLRRHGFRVERRWPGRRRDLYVARRCEQPILAAPPEAA